MRKNLVLKIVTFIVLNIFILSVGAVSFAKAIPPDNINWSHLNSCGILFEISDDNYPYFYIGGTTTTGSNVCAYVLLELQKLTDDPNEVIWETVYSAEDSGELIAAKEEEVEAEVDTTYRLKVTHEARTLSGDLLERYVRYSGARVIWSED